MVYPNKKFDELIKRNHSSLIHLEAKIAYLNDGVKGLGDGFKDFKEDITNFMAFTAETYSDHETRIKTWKVKSNDRSQYYWLHAYARTNRNTQPPLAMCL